MKIIRVETILTETLSAREKGQSIVLVTGVFDVLHQEHINFLNKAKAAGDYLLVGIETDKRVRKMKGEDRPKNSEFDRLQTIKELGIADNSFLLPDKFEKPNDHKKLITLLKPDILAVSSHTSHQEKKARIMDSVGGELKVVHTHNPKISTTKIIKPTH